MHNITVAENDVVSIYTVGPENLGRTGTTLHVQNHDALVFLVAWHDELDEVRDKDVLTACLELVMIE